MSLYKDLAEKIIGREPMFVYEMGPKAVSGILRALCNLIETAQEQIEDLQARVRDLEDDPPTGP